jgi:hypothetical protein
MEDFKPCKAHDWKVVLQDLGDSNGLFIKGGSPVEADHFAVVNWKGVKHVCALWIGWNTLQPIIWNHTCLLEQAIFERLQFYFDPEWTNDEFVIAASKLTTSEFKILEWKNFYQAK